MCITPIKAYVFNKHLLREKIAGSILHLKKPIFTDKELDECKYYDIKYKDYISKQRDLYATKLLRQIDNGEISIKKISLGKRPNNTFWDCYEMIELPCSKCEECKLKKATDWGVKAFCEMQTSDTACFITFTYNNENLPKKRSLQYKDFQKFMKRLRKKYGKGIRFICGAEYGPTTKRPHYHAIIFNYKPNDLIYFKHNQTGQMLFTSKELDKIWGLGYTMIGTATFETIKYVARYTTKKLSENETVKEGREKERIRASNKPGIGINWLMEKQNFNKITKNLYILIDGKSYEIPKSFIKKIKNLMINIFGEFNEWEYYKRKNDQEKANKIEEKLLKYGPKNSNQRYNKLKTIYESRLNHLTRDNL